MKNTKTNLVSVIVAALVLAMAGVATAKDELPDQTTDGLNRIESKNVQAVYWQDGATLAPYTKVMLIECSVAFRKNWMKDHNRGSADLTNRVGTDDMDRIKKSLSAEFDKEFTKVLEEGGYTVVQNPGDDVLLLRPALINLDVTAPDLKSIGTTRSYAASAGQMTLYLELYDSATSSKIGLVLDAQAARDNGMMRVSNSVTNRAEAGKMLRRWSSLLVAAMDEAKNQGE
jgi:hypothetical protein